MRVPEPVKMLPLTKLKPPIIGRCRLAGLTFDRFLQSTGIPGVAQWLDGGGSVSEPAVDRSIILAARGSAV